ncbi:hypothetical protein D9619_007384 [Psilocybe cf. subviscida]|uniref:Nephrocystin 3-like N-terminal domain-containing protein n=1 Tax=Psilocybe cf. subviscida TaxID=2480587 RepID=A0A8H5B290_9AGAR|nr:hypothetical protein D9619_007384 [Psilocybe cf. subviscida]
MSNQMFTGASNFMISGGNFVSHTHSEKSGREKLSAAAAHSALHNAPARTDESRCYQNTRENVLDHLERWAQGICDERASIFWLHGGAGAGKSAIMQTLAERYVAQGLALGSFFFSRSDTTRNTAEPLIPTLVYQLVQLCPQALQVLDSIIDHDPLIFKKSLRAQVLDLLVLPLQHLVQLGIVSEAPQSPRVFLIDGLDECSDPAQQQVIIKAVTAVCHKHRIPIKFLIASRPEQAISTSFEWHKQENCVLGAISLSEDADAEADIHRFIEAQFWKIRLQHPFKKMIPSEWPDAVDIYNLVSKSSSHFIYASTAMKYIWLAKDNPVRSLQVVLGLKVSRTISPFSELDALYHHILGSAAHRDKVLQILAHRVYTHLPSFASVVCIMLNFSKDDLLIYLADMTPLVGLPQSALLLHEQEVKRLHASLGDFLYDQSRSGLLYVNRDAYLTSTLERCFQLLDLYSREQRTSPNWPVSIEEPYSLPYFHLVDQVVTIIEQPGCLFGTQEISSQYILRDSHWHWCETRFKHLYGEIRPQPFGIFKFLQAVHSIRTSDAANRLFRRLLEGVFDILELYISETNIPLAPAIMPLIFLGYPARQILSYHLDWQAYQFFDAVMNYLDNPWSQVVTMEDLASIRHSRVNTSPKSSALAAEAVLGYLFDGVKLHSSSTCSAHKSWMQRTKPGKHIALGAPRLASALHKRCLSSLRLLQDEAYREKLSNHSILPFQLQALPMVLGKRHRFSLDRLDRQKNANEMVISLLEALLWVLPKASFLQKIVAYSKRIFSRNIYQLNTSLIHRVHKCLERYSVRVRNAELEALKKGIEDGKQSVCLTFV